MTNPKLTKFISIGVGIVIAVLLIVMGFKVFSGVFTRAADLEPRDVVVSSISQNSTKVSWATGTETQGVIEYGTTPTALNFFAPEPSKVTTHSQDLTLLSPNTTYYFQIRIGSTKYDNGGVPWTFTTKATVESIAPSVTPTPVNTIVSPTPIQILRISVTGSPVQNCNYKDCATVKANLGKGCNTGDYWNCLKKTTPTP